jgi:hypothetical protein
VGIGGLAAEEGSGILIRCTGSVVSKYQEVLINMRLLQMKKLFKLLIALICFAGTVSQAYSATLGNATKLEKGTKMAVDCFFPGTSDSAPGWVCDEPVDGYEMTAVGSVPNASNSPDNKLPPLQHALLNAVISLASNLKIKVETDAKSGKSKQMQNIKFGGNISVTSTAKGYKETSGEGKNTVIEEVTTTNYKLVMTSPCAFMMKSSVETVRKGDSESVEVVSEETNNKCTIQDVVKELSNSGIDVIETIKDSRGNIYLMVGSRKISAIKISY